MKPFFSDKGVKNGSITLIEGGNIISDDKDVANTLNNFFENAVSSLGIQIPEEFITDTTDISDPIEAIVARYSNHPSIISIKNSIKKSSFSFTEVELNDMKKELDSLDSKKACVSNSIPTKLLKEHSDICSVPLTHIFNSSVVNSNFDKGLKYADLTPVHKDEETTEKSNYRQISILPVVSKVFEKMMQKQIGAYIQKFLSPFLCGYRKGFSPQYALLSLLEKWRISLDKKGFGGAILMDLSKAFDTLNHDLLIAKLHAYGFENSALRMIKSYLSNRWQRTKVNNSFSSWSELLTGVPQGSVLGPLLFNLFINDFFYLINESDVCNYADDNTLHACDLSLSKLMDKLEGAAESAICWFKNNGMKLNSSKCHLLVGGHKYEQMIGTIGNSKVIESHIVKLLGIFIDSDLTFNHHINLICKKASTKLNALSRQCAILPFPKRKMLMQAFFSSRFAYCPLVWMFHSRKLNTKINRLQYRALRIVYRDETSTFQELLDKDGSVTIHHRNLQILATEMFKCLNGLAPTFMSDIFVVNSNLSTENVSANTRSQSFFHNPVNPRTTNYGIETLRHLGPVIWDMIPSEIKNAASVAIFKNKIKGWIPTKCPCRLCKTFICNIGYV